MESEEKLKNGSTLDGIAIKTIDEKREESEAVPRAPPMSPINVDVEDERTQTGFWGLQSLKSTILDKKMSIIVMFIVYYF